MIYTGDCLEVMRTLPSESVDSVVTDPPAGISFMSKNWDHDKGGRTAWVAWMTEVMQECYRLLKPGGYAVVWSLPRTCHWTGWAMEDAGFIIRDQLAHIFASGFPKGKAQLKPAREDWWLARKPGPLRPLAIDACRIGYTSASDSDEVAGKASKNPTGKTGLYGVPGVATFNEGGRWPSNVLLSDPDLFDVANPGVVGSGAVTSDGVAVRRNTGIGQGMFGTGTDEPSEDVTFGGGGGYSRFFRIPQRENPEQVEDEDQRLSDPMEEAYERGRLRGYALRLQEEAIAREAAPDYPSHFIIPKADRADREPVLRPEGHEAGKRFSTHPTMKPTDLMRHLIRLVTPVGGTVLDCFLGSGTTAIAAEMEGFAWIGIEKEPEYVAIAEARLNGVQRGLGLDFGSESTDAA